MKKSLLLLLLFFLFACDPFDAIIEDDKEAISFYEAKQQTDAIPLTRNLQIATWNIKFGGGRIDFFFDLVFGFGKD